MSTSTPVSQRAAARTCSALLFDTGVKRSYSIGTGAYSQQKGETDAIGSTIVTFQGVPAGTEVRVYSQARVELAGVDSSTENPALSWPVYPNGSPNNTVYITILKRGYRWQKFNHSSTMGAATIPIFMSTDLGYNNPA